MKKLIAILGAIPLCLVSASAFAAANLVLVAYINVGNPPAELTPAVSVVGTFPSLADCNKFAESKPPLNPVGGIDAKPFAIVLRVGQ
jgi:hypothetical protein